MRIAWMLLVVSLVVAGLACVVGFASGELAEEQILRISVDALDLGTADPHMGTGTHHRVLYDLIFNGLVRYAPGEYPRIEPDLAVALPESRIEDCKQVWTFELSQGVLTHPFPGYPGGYEITAEDVVYSFERVRDPERSTYASDYVGWEIAAVDTYTVEITIPMPTSEALFLPLVADYMGGMIVPKKAEESMGHAEYRMNPIGTGPFKWAEYRPMDRIILQAHKAYFRGRPVLDEVHLVYIAEIGAAEVALRTGELEAVIGPMEQPWVEKMEGYEGIIVDVYGPGENVTLHYNMGKAPLDSLKVRQALSYAMSREFMVALFGQDIAVPTYSIVPYGYLPGGVSREMLGEAGYSWEVEYDPKLARDLLEEAGYGDGFTLEAYASERDYYIRPFEVVQELLRAIGVELRITVVDHATYHARIREDTNHLVFYNSWRPSADMYLTRFFHSASRVVVGAAPDTNFSHADMIDYYIESARKELDTAKQEELWQEGQLILTENAAYTSFCLLQLTTARANTVDWGHPVVASATLYPQIDEKTHILVEGS
jgi:peptide/nickel transport system substrate-binding protein